MSNPFETEDISKVMKRLADLEDRIHGTPFKANIYRRAHDKIEQLKRYIEELEGEKMGYKRCGLCGCMDVPVNSHNDCSICAKQQYAD
jgi:uncharacterized OB-fold protein